MALPSRICSARVRRYLAASLAALCMSGIAWGSGRWLKMSKGLDGGRVNFLAINPVDSMTVYAGASGASLFRSRDGGASWSPIRKGLPDTVISELVIAPSDPSRLYIEVNAGFYRSRDEGTHWEAINGGLPLGIETPDSHSLEAAAGYAPGGNGVFLDDFAVDPVDADRLYIASSLGVYRSSDAGDSWALANQGLTDLAVFIVEVDPRSPSTLYAVTRTEVFRSDDGADSWEMLAGGGLQEGFPEFLILTETVPSTLFFAVRNQGVFKSVDSGDSWEAANNGLPDDDVRELVVDPGDPLTVYAIFLSSGVYRTRNGGDDWDELTVDNPLVTDFRSLVVDPQNSDVLYAGDRERGVFRSTDEAETWEASSRGLTAVEVLALEVDEEMPDTLYAGTLGNGGYKSTDGGENWQRLDDLYPFTVERFQIHPQVRATVYAAANSSVYRSLDAGETWEKPANTGLPGIGVRDLVMDPQTPGNLFAGVRSGSRGVYRTSDGGENWERVNNGLTTTSVVSLAIDPGTPATLYAGTLNGLFRTEDSGDNWEQIDNGLTAVNIRPIAIDPKTPSTIYVGTLDGGAFRSLDGGDNWEAINDGLADQRIDALAVDPVTPALYAGDDGMFRSLNGGQSWESISSGLFQRDMTSIAIHPLNPSVLYVGTQGDGVYKCASQHLYFPLLTGDASSFTGVALANDFDGPTGFDLEARAGDGLLQPYPDNPHTEVLGPGKQIARLGLEFFGLDGAQERDGWMQLWTDGARLASFFQFGTVTGSRLGRLDGSVAITELSTTLYFTRIYDGPATFPVDSGALDGSTTLVVANPTDQAQTLTFTIYDSDGARGVAAREREVPPLGCLRVRVIELFEVASATGGFIEVTANGGGVVGFEYVSVGDTVLGFNAWTQPTGEIYSAQLAHGTAGFAVTTSLKVINTSSDGQSYTLEAISADGTQLFRQIFGLGRQDSREFNMGELLGLGSVDLPATTGSIRVTSEAEVFLGDVMFGDPFQARFAAALPMQATLLTQATFSQVANLDEGPVSGRTFTGLALFNPDLVEVTIRVTVFSADCLEVGSTEIRLGPGERLSEVVAVLVPESAGQVRGYITLRATHPIVAQVLFGNGTLDFLSAVPPTIFY